MMGGGSPFSGGSRSFPQQAQQAQEAQEEDAEEDNQ